MILNSFFIIQKYNFRRRPFVTNFSQKERNNTKYTKNKFKIDDRYPKKIFKSEFKNYKQELEEFKKKLRVEKFPQIQILPKEPPSVPYVSKRIMPQQKKRIINKKKVFSKKKIQEDDDEETKTNSMSKNFKIKLQLLMTQKKYPQVLREFGSFLLHSPEYLTHNHYKIILHAHVRTNHLKNTENFFQNIQKLNEVDTTMYNMMIGMYNKHGKFEESKKLLEDMKKNGDTLPGVDTFTSFLSHFGIRGKIKEMKEILFQMRELEIDLDTKAFCSLMNGFVKSGKEDEGLIIFETMKTQKVKPSTQCYNIAMSVYFNSDNFKKIIQLFQEMKKYYLMPDSVTCNMVLQAYEREKNYPAVLEVYEDTKNFLKFTPNMYGLIIRLYHSQKDCTKALEVWTKFINSKSKGSLLLYIEVMKLFHTINSLPQAIELFSYLKKTKYFHIIHCNVLLSLYILNGMYKEALEVENEIKVKEFKPNHQTFTLLLNLYVKAEMVQEAKECFDKIKSIHLGIPYTSLQDLSEMFRKNGQNENADMVIKEGVYKLDSTLKV